jgi:hypothetical protein
MEEMVAALERGARSSDGRAEKRLALLLGTLGRGLAVLVGLRRILRRLLLGSCLLEHQSAPLL